MGLRSGRADRSGMVAVDLTTRVGSVELPSPVMNASGTAGHALELAEYAELDRLGAFVAKSLCADPWAGNPAPRVHMTRGGMINSVGLQGPGVAAWLRDDLPQLRAAGVRRVVVSIWGRSVDAYRSAATLLADAPDEIVAVEVNLSCPNTESGRELFAHDPRVAGEVVAACAEVAARPVWAKLSPNTDRLVEVAGAVATSGAEAVTLVNTLFGMVIDPEIGRPVLSGGGGGVSGPAIHPMAVRAVYDVHAACPDLPIIGVGGISTGTDAVEMLMAGASAVQIGTALFADPRVLTRVRHELEQWCSTHGVAAVRRLLAVAHGSNEPR